MNILLLGVLGSGKTSVGESLASHLGYKFVELDHEVLKITGYTSIHEIFNKKKSLWEECELEIVQDISVEDNQVVACGGAMMMNHLNIQYFKENSSSLLIIYLEANTDEILKRINHRDLEFTDEEIKSRLDHVLNRRDYFYRYYATHIINTENKSVKDSVLEIKKIIENHKF